MIILFVCDGKDCANKGVVYRMDSETSTALCGGCKETLIGTPEQEEETNG